MIQSIIEKELQDNLLNMRFVVASAIAMLLIVVTVLTLEHTYRTGRADYQDRQSVQEDFIQHYGHLNRVGWMARPLQPPGRYSFLVTGIDREAQQENFLSNPMPVLFSQTDLIMIVTIIMSLMAILFSYNSISGEREAGLLKQMLSANISRSAILFGKFFGGSISLLVPFVLGLLAGYIVIAVDPDIQLQRSDLGVFLLLLVASGLYISAFYALGLCFSARSRTSNVAVLKSLFVWVVLVLMLPNISPFLAARVYHIPSKTKIDFEVWKITSDERDTLVHRKARELLTEKYRDIADLLRNHPGGNTDSIFVRMLENTTTLKEHYLQFQKDWMTVVNQVNADQQAKADVITKDFESKSKHQEKIATAVASISPLADYTLAATTLTDAGIEGDNHWQDEVKQYYDAMNPILMKIYNDAIAKNPKLTVNDFIDLHGLPRFQYHPEQLSVRADTALPYIGMLIFYNLLFLIVGWVSFLRYDVR